MTDGPTTPEPGAPESLAESTLRELVEHANDLIMITGADGRLRYVNPAGRALLGLEPHEDVRHLAFPELTEEGISDDAHAAWGRLWASGQVSREVRLKNLRDGVPVTIATRSFLLRPPSGDEPVAFATIARDIGPEVLAREARDEVLGQQRSLLLQMYETQEWERRRVADEVHDDVLQALAAATLRMQTLGRMARAAGQPELAEQLDTLDADVHASVRRMRALLADLDPPGMEDPDLASALTELVRATFPGDERKMVLVDVPQQAALSDTLRRGVFRLVRESLTNARKHARATRIVVSVAEADGQVVVTVQDDGVGLRGRGTLDGERGHGLRSMRQLAGSLGGQLELADVPGGGSLVRAVIPARVGHLAPDPGAAVRRALEETLDALPQAFLVLDSSLVVAWCNAAAMATAGLRRADVVGRPLAEVFTVPDDFVSRFKHALASGKPDRWRTWSINLSTYVEIRLNPFGTGASLYITDVTEQVERESFEKAVRGLQDLARAVVATMIREPDLDVVMAAICEHFHTYLSATGARVVLDDGRVWASGEPGPAPEHRFEVGLAGRRYGDLEIGAWAEGFDAFAPSVGDLAQAVSLRIAAEAGLSAADPG